MNKSRFLILLIVGLLISNGILLFMYLKEHGIRTGGPKKHIMEKLHFDKEQINQYEGYIKVHRKEIRQNEDKMNDLRSSLYAQLKNSSNEVTVDSLISEISKQQYAAEKINYKHFLEIKNICKPTQKQDFEELSAEIINLFSDKRRK